MEFHAAVAELEALIETLEREGDERAFMLLDLVDAIHRPGLERLAAGQPDHPEAYALLAMYELVDVPDETYVEEALEEVRPYLHEHGGEVELLEVTDGAVHLRFGGACRGGMESAAELRAGVERALREHYRDFREIVAHEPDAGMALPVAGAGPAGGSPSPGAAATPAGTGGAPPAGDGDVASGGSGGPRVLSLDNLRRPVFTDVGAASELQPGQKKAVEVDGTPILVLNVEGEIHAFKNVCATDGRSELDGARLADTVLVCPWHNCAYDARSGKRVDGEDAPGLAVVPIAVRDGSLQVAVTTA